MSWKCPFRQRSWPQRIGTDRDFSLFKMHGMWWILASSDKIHGQWPRWLYGDLTKISMEVEGIMMTKSVYAMAKIAFRLYSVKNHPKIHNFPRNSPHFPSKTPPNKIIISLVNSTNKHQNIFRVNPPPLKSSFLLPKSHGFLLEIHRANPGVLGGCIDDIP